MSVKGIGENRVALQTDETNSLPKGGSTGSSAPLSSADEKAVHFMIARFAGDPSRQDDLEQTAKRLIDKHTPKSVILTLVGVDSEGLGAELAGLITKQPRLGGVVLAQLSAGDRVDVARAMIDNSSDETLKQLAKTADGKALLEQVKGLLDSERVDTWDLRSLFRLFRLFVSTSGDAGRKTRIENALGNQPIEQKPQAREVDASGDTEFKGISEEQLEKIVGKEIARKLGPAKLAEYTRLLNGAMKEFGINTPAQQAAFLATCAAETTGFTKLTEVPSNYGSSKSPYKGRGFIQLTGEENYRAASKYFFGSEDVLCKDPKLAAEPELAARIAGWYWAKNRIKYWEKNRIKSSTPNEQFGEQPREDLRDFRRASGMVNAGNPMRQANHWGYRLIFYLNALEALGIEISPKMRANIEENIKNHTGKKNYFLKKRERP